MLTAATALALILTAPTARMAPASSAGEIRFHWRGEEHALDPLPEELPEPAAEALGQWAVWADAHGCELHLDDEGRVLFVAEKPRSATLALIGRTTELFDAHLAAPERAPADGAGATRTAGPSPGPETRPAEPEDAIPDDPETGASGVPLREALGGTPKWQSSWGAGSDVLDRATIVLLALDPEGYAAALEHLVDGAPALEGWASAAESGVGFVLESPLVGAWLHGKGGEGGEEWSPEAELVHRLTELLSMRRFGRQPYWITKGICWHAEMKLRGSIYCYPFRDEFVYVVEHESWPLDVRNRMKKEFKEGSLTLGHFSALRRGAWNGEAARLAYAAMAWLIENRAEGLPAALEELRQTYERDCRIDKGGGLWERDVTYEIPDATVQQAFEKQLGAEVLAELTEGLKTIR